MVDDLAVLEDEQVLRGLILDLVVILRFHLTLLICGIEPRLLLLNKSTITPSQKNNYSVLVYAAYY